MSSDRQDVGANLDDIRPLVATNASNRSLWVFGFVLALAAALLFLVLESRREGITAPATSPTAQGYGAQLSSPAPLAIPAETPPNQEVYPPDPTTDAPRFERPASLRQAMIEPAPRPPAYAPPEPWRPEPRLPPAATSSPAMPAVVYSPNRPVNAASGGNGANAATKDERVEATHFRNPSSTVPKGTVIHAVLETALDSTRAGFARALVSRDVFSFDGSQILIPKGSRLIGEYKSDLSLGQNRALIQWQRMMRPDGVMIDLDSPSADPLGRAGIKGTVNSHFFERFGGAILQSSLDIGVQLATSKVANGTVIYALPGDMRGAMPTQEKVQPTVTVKQGTSVSVFVARDLDFTAVQ